MAISVYHLTLNEKQQEALVFLQYTGWKMTQLLADCPYLNPHLQKIRDGLCHDWWQFMHELHPAFQAAIHAPPAPPEINQALKASQRRSMVLKDPRQGP